MQKKLILLFVVAATVAVCAMLRLKAERKGDGAEEKTSGADIFESFGGAASDIERISLTRHQYDHGAYRAETSVLQKTESSGWKMVAPVSYPVNLALVHEILGTLRTLKPRPQGSAEKGAAPTQAGVSAPYGVEVSLLLASRGEVRFAVGRTLGDITYLAAGDRPDLFIAPGRIRKVFDRGPSDLRLRRIIRFEKGAIERMTFHNRGKPFVLVRAGEAGGVRYRSEGTPIKNFDEPKASHRAEALSRLRTKDFYDAPHRFSASDLRVTLDVRTDGEVRQVTLTFGARDPKTGLHFAASSLSEQIFLLSPHMKSLFTATPDGFSLTDEQAARRRALQAELARHAHVHGAHGTRIGSEGNGSDNDDFGTDAHFENHVE